MKKIISAILCGAILGLSTMASAKPKLSQQTKYYQISATSLDALKKEMNARGPDGHWAYTAWHVNWTGSCTVSIKVTYTLPKHSNPSSMPASVRSAYDKMLKALIAHEQQHGQHGIMAARDIEKDGCKNGNAILKKYNAMDIKFDKTTNHGIKTGATLP